MKGTMKPKGSREERNRAEYVENKQKALEESLRVVAMRKTVFLHPTPSQLDCADGMCSGGRLGRTGYRNRVHHGMCQNDISDRLEEIHLHKLLPSHTTTLHFEEDVFRVFLQFSMPFHLMGTSFVHTFELPNSMLVLLHFSLLYPVK